MSNPEYSICVSLPGCMPVSDEYPYSVDCDLIEAMDAIESEVRRSVEAVGGHPVHWEIHDELLDEGRYCLEHDEACVLGLPDGMVLVVEEVQ